MNDSDLRSLNMVVPRKPYRRIARLVLSLIVLTGLALWLVPWQQTIVGSGEVAVFDPNARPQTIEARIPGQLKSWRVVENQLVKAGDVLGEIEDIDSKFLDSDLENRTKRQLDQLKGVMMAEKSRLQSLQMQVRRVRDSQAQQIANARERVKQARNRVSAAIAAKRQSEKNLEGLLQFAKLSAKQRRLQQEDALRQAEQNLVIATQSQDIAKINFERTKYLEEKGIDSKRALELAETEYVNAKARVKQAQDAKTIAKRAVDLGVLSEGQADVDIARQREAVRQADESVRASERDVAIAQNDISRIENDTEATLASLAASIQSVQSSIAKASSEIEKVGMDQANLKVRRRQQKILAPVDGRVVRVQKFGNGATVKTGDILATLVPVQTDRVVELMVSDNDVAFIDVGRPTRIQFAGFPALQFSGIPGASVGTFGGRVKAIDPVDDGTARFRVIIEEDRLELIGGKKDAPWPKSSNLRPGAEAVGWIMLDTVPLGFELWRQFNGFAPRRPSFKADPRLSKDNKPEEDRVDKANGQDYLSPTIKVKSKR